MAEFLKALLKFDVNEGGLRLKMTGAFYPVSFCRTELGPFVRLQRDFASNPDKTVLWKTAQRVWSAIRVLTA